MQPVKVGRDDRPTAPHARTPPFLELFAASLWTGIQPGMRMVEEVLQQKAKVEVELARLRAEHALCQVSLGTVSVRCSRAASSEAGILVKRFRFVHSLVLYDLTQLDRCNLHRLEMNRLWA